MNNRNKARKQCKFSEHNFESCRGYMAMLPRALIEKKIIGTEELKGQ